MTPFLASLIFAHEARSDPRRVVVVEDKEQAEIQLQNPGSLVWIESVCAADLRELMSVYEGRVSGNTVEILDQISIINNIKPRVRTVIIPITSGERCKTKKEIAEYLFEHNIKVNFIEVEPNSASLKEVARNIDNADAIFMTPLSHLYEDPRLKYWFALAIKNNIPLIGAWSKDQLRQGVAAGRFISTEQKKQCFEQGKIYIETNGRWPKKCGTKPTLEVNERVTRAIGIVIEND